MSTQGVFKKVTENINHPLLRDEIEFMLIEAGLEVSLPSREFNKNMKACGFVRKQIMSDGERTMKWVRPDMQLNTMDSKIKFVAFMTKHLKGKKVFPFMELIETLKKEGFNSDTWNHYFYADEMKRNWRGWGIAEDDGVKVYKLLKGGA